MSSNVYFITGVNGVGKTSVMPYLRELLPTEKYDIHDFDERGVPDGADRTWRKTELAWWLSEATKLAEKGVKTIICGFAKPEDFGESALKPVLILLDASPEVIRERLIKRYTKNGVFDESQKVIGKPVNDFIAGNVYYCDVMREEFKQTSYPIIDTTSLSSEEVAQKLFEIIIDRS
jgi:broad-specificity NMP kinase